MRFKLILLFLFVSIINWGQNPYHKVNVGRFLNNFKSIKCATQYKDWSKSACVGARTIQADALQWESYMPAILYLWKNNEHSYLELLWWKTKNSDKRLTILACFYGQSSGDDEYRHITTWPNFEEQVSRFNDQESVQRRKEIEFIKKNNPTIHKIIKQKLTD